MNNMYWLKIILKNFIKSLYYHNILNHDNVGVYDMMKDSPFPLLDSMRVFNESHTISLTSVFSESAVPSTLAMEGKEEAMSVGLLQNAQRRRQI